MSLDKWIAREEVKGSIIMGEDGYYVYWPLDRNGGAFDVAALRAMADYLDKRNKVWDDQVQEYFNK